MEMKEEALEAEMTLNATQFIFEGLDLNHTRNKDFKKN